MSGKRSIPKAEELLPQAKDVFQAISGEQPLGCALIVGASIEKACLALVGKYFIEGDTAKGLLSENGSLGTFASCSKVAYCLGLISKGMYENINTVGRIRNRFAHSNTLIDFTDPEVIELCERLTLPSFFHFCTAVEQNKPMEEVCNSPRERFSHVGIMLFSSLLRKALEAERRVRITDVWDYQTRFTDRPAQTRS